MKLTNQRHVHDEFDDFNQVLQARLDRIKSPLFKPNPLGFPHPASMWDTYIGSFPSQQRQYYNCHCCKSFIDKYGDAIYFDGTAWRSALWRGQDAEPKEFVRVNERMRIAVQHRISAISTSRDCSVDLMEVSAPIGHYHTGPFSHFHLLTPVRMRRSLQQVHEWRAARDRMNAVTWCQSTYAKVDKLAKLKMLGNFEGQQHMLNFLRKWAAAPHAEKMVMLVDASESVTHPRNSVLASLFDDLESGVSERAAAESFKKKMDPLKYQRPTAPIAAQQLQKTQAEFEKSGYDRSMLRRYMPIDYPPVDALMWKAEKKSPAEATGVFYGISVRGSHKEKKDILRESTMSWHVFARDILPNATKIEWKVQNPCTLATLVCAADASAPPVLIWDDLKCRNTASWSVPAGGKRYNELIAKTWVEVLQIIKSPAIWNRRKDAQWGASCFMQLDVSPEIGRIPHSGLFPELLHGNLYQHKRAIELVNNKHDSSLWHNSTQNPKPYALPVGREDTHKFSGTFKVHTESGVLLVTIDRFE